MQPTWDRSKYKAIFKWPQNGRSLGNAFKQVLNIDLRFKAVSRTLENKNSNVKFTSKLNSTLKTIANATADKMSARVEIFHFFPPNRPRSIYRYSNMAPRLSGQTSIFGVVFFVSKSLLGIDRQKKL